MIHIFLNYDYTNKSQHIKPTRQSPKEHLNGHKNKQVFNYISQNLG